MLRSLSFLLCLQVIQENIQHIAGMPVSAFEAYNSKRDFDWTSKTPRRGISGDLSLTLNKDTTDVLAALNPTPSAAAASSMLQIDSDAVLADIKTETANISTSIMDSINRIVSSIFGAIADDTDSSTGISTNANVAVHSTTLPTTLDNSSSTATTSTVPIATPTSSDYVQDTTVSNVVDSSTTSNATSGYAIVPITANGVTGIAILPVGNSSLDALVSSLTSSAAAPVTSAVAAVIAAADVTSADATPSSATTTAMPAVMTGTDVPDQTVVSATASAVPAATSTSSPNNFNNGTKSTVNKTPAGTGSLPAGQAEEIEDSATNPNGVRIDGALPSTGASIIINMGSNTTPTSGSITITS